MMRSPLWARLGIVLLLVLSGCSARGTEAMRLLNDIDAGFAASALKRETPAPERRAVAYEIEGRAHRGDLYLSPQGSLAALVLVPGLAEEGKDDPRLVALATSLARVRFAVLVPDIAHFRRLVVDGGDSRDIADAALWLLGHDRLEAQGGVGIAAISYAVGPALLATRDPRLDAAVAFFVAIGGYYDLTQALTFATTGFYRENDRWRAGQAHAYGKWVFVLSNAAKLADASDRAGLAAIARRKLTDPGAAIDDLSRYLGSEGRAVMALAENTDPDAVPALIAALPPSLKAEMARLDPSVAGFGDARAEMILIHGRADPVIPYTESIALKAAWPQERARLYLLDGLLHVDTALTLSDRLVLWDAAIDLLQQRDGLAARASGF